MTTKNYDFLKLLQGKGFNQVRLCRQCKSISEPMLSRIINGHHLPTDEQIDTIARLLNVSVAKIQNCFKKSEGKN